GPRQVAVDAAALGHPTGHRGDEQWYPHRVPQEAHAGVHVVKVQVRQGLMLEPVAFEAGRNAFRGDIFFEVDADMVDLTPTRRRRLTHARAPPCPTAQRPTVCDSPATAYRAQRDRETTGTAVPGRAVRPQAASFALSASIVP